jgi:hypothetical protein
LASSVSVNHSEYCDVKRNQILARALMATID